jgi:hypothetical protein
VAITGYWGFLRRRGALARALANGSRPEHGERSATSERCGCSLLYAPTVSCTRTQGDSDIKDRRADSAGTTAGRPGFGLRKRGPIAPSDC